MNERSIKALETDAGKRIDAFVSEKMEELTRSAAQRLLEDGKVQLQGQPLKKNYRLTGNEEILVLLPEAKATDIIAQNLPLDIVYEDADIIVVNKARGMVVHPAAGNWDGTLVNALMYHCGERLSGINGEIRPGIVHRIDKDTSGLLVVAKNDHAHQVLAAQIKTHDVLREYEAIVYGTIQETEGTINRPIGRHKTNRKMMAIMSDGRSAITHFKVVERYAGYTYMVFRLETGRTHQIRVHMASIGHPIIGDPVYGVKKDKFSTIGGQCLHARKLMLKHPTSGEEMVFCAPRPLYFETILSKMRNSVIGE